DRAGARAPADGGGGYGVGMSELRMIDDGPKAKDACGLFGIWGDDDSAVKTYYGLFALQHRGQESAGIAATDGKRIERHRDMGRVPDVFASERTLKSLAGRAAIGHVRYSTMGSSTVANAQPLVAVTHAGTFAVAHNGNLTNGPALRRDFEAKGS